MRNILCQFRWSSFCRVSFLHLFYQSVSRSPRPCVNWCTVEDISLCVSEVPLWDANIRWTSWRMSWDSDTQWLCLHKGWILDLSPHIKLSANSRNSLLLEVSTMFPVFAAPFPTRISSLSLTFLSAETHSVLLGDEHELVPVWFLLNHYPQRPSFLLASAFSYIFLIKNSSFPNRNSGVNDNIMHF